MSKTIHRLVVVALALGLGLVGMVPAMAGDDAGIIHNNLDAVFANDLPTIVDDVDGGVAQAPAAVGGLLGGLLGGGNGLLGGLLGGEHGLVGGLLGGPGGVLGGILGAGDRLAILPTGDLAGVDGVVEALGDGDVPPVGGDQVLEDPRIGGGLLAGGGLLGGLLHVDSITQALAGRL